MASFEVQNDTPSLPCSMSRAAEDTQCGILQHKKKFSTQNFFSTQKFFQHKFLNTKFLNTKIVVLKKNFQHEIVVLNKKFFVEKKFYVGHIIVVM